MTKSTNIKLLYFLIPVIFFFISYVFALSLFYKVVNLSVSFIIVALFIFYGGYINKLPSNIFHNFLVFNLLAMITSIIFLFLDKINTDFILLYFTFSLFGLLISVFLGNKLVNSDLDNNIYFLYIFYL